MLKLPNVINLDPNKVYVVTSDIVVWNVIYGCFVSELA
jgi:hypothetical protein